MHVEIRICRRFYLCPCGVHIQYRQDIYMYHMCEGLLIDGFVYGNGESIYLNKHSNGFSAEFSYVSSNYIRPGLLFACYNNYMFYNCWLVFP